MKVLMQTIGRFQLICPDSGQLLRFDRPTLVTRTSFFESRVHRGQVEQLLVDVPDRMTDQDFEKVWVTVNKDVGAAVAEFQAKYKTVAKRVPAPGNPVVTPTVAPEAKGK